MFRRLSSLHRVAVDRSLSLLHEKASPSLRYYSDAKTSCHPFRRASFSFAWRYHGCIGCFAPVRGPTRLRWAGVFIVGGHPMRRRLIRGDDRISQVPAEPSCRCAHAPTTPEEPDGTRLCVPPARHWIRERPALLHCDFRSSIAWPDDSLSTLRRDGSPPSTQDSLAAAG
jgi:hypothetical protein